jgi:hypothetical protein
MSRTVKQLSALLVICAIAMIGANAAYAKGANYSCSISGTFNASWSGSCKMDSGGALKCSGGTSLPSLSNQFYGTCSGSDPIFGATKCSLRGMFSSIGGGTWVAGGPVGCSYGVGFSCSDTWKGTGVTGAAGAFKGQLGWFC